MPEPSAAELTAKSSFIFRGTVQQLNAATLPEVADRSRTAIVRVDEVLQSPEVLSHYGGQNITVQLSEPIAAGRQATFFTNAWLFGNEGVAVRSVGHMDPGAETLEPHMSGVDPVANLENRRARERYDAAEMVISGTVENVRVVPESQRAPREHDPHWREATIKVSATHKGGTPQEEVVVRFPASGDRAWHGRPKLKPGDKGQFVLHKAAAEAMDWYTLMHPEDFEPESKPGPMHRLVQDLEVR
jgi:hypothetical protein